MIKEGGCAFDLSVNEEDSVNATLLPLIEYSHKSGPWLPDEAGKGQKIARHKHGEDKGQRQRD